jgi:hypothetical protein
VESTGAVFEAKFMLAVVVLRGSGGRKAYGPPSAQHVGDPVPNRFASPKDEAAWIMQHFFGATLWKGRPKFAVDPLPAMPSQEPQRTAEAVRRILPALIKLNRYESRAVTRRDRAIRAITLRSKT